jgi:predicted DsbA family dithiol-disulfide isomerase/uncharacterized membrane protein
MTEANRKSDWTFVAFWTLAAVGLGVSALLFYEYVTPAAQFCGDGGGCDVVRNSAYAFPLGIPTPAFGVAFFGAVLLASLAPRARRFLIPLALAGGVGGAGFVAVQAFALHAYCKYCLVADGALLALAGLVFLLPAELPARRWRPAGLSTAIGVAIPILIGVMTGVAHDEVAAGEVPDVIARERRPGIATIVEFMDFQCPYCREQHQTMKQVVADYADRVRVVYKHVPLPNHRHAEDAARAACCAEEQEKEIAVADALFSSEDLTPEACARLAEQAGLDMQAYGECMASDRPDRRLSSDLEDARAIGLRGLPTFFVNDVRLEGLKDANVVRGAIDHALAQN